MEKSMLHSHSQPFARNKQKQKSLFLSYAKIKCSLSMKARLEKKKYVQSLVETYFVGIHKKF